MAPALRRKLEQLIEGVGELEASLVPDHELGLALVPEIEGLPELQRLARECLIELDQEPRS